MHLNIYEEQCSPQRGSPANHSAVSLLWHAALIALRNTFLMEQDQFAVMWDAVIISGLIDHL